MRKFFLAVALVLAGCGGEAPRPEAQQSVTSPIVGCWRTATVAGTYDMTFSADGTCAYLATKPNGFQVGFSCTWSADSDAVTVVASTWSTTNDYAVTGNALALTPASGVPAIYQRRACP